MIYPDEIENDFTPINFVTGQAGQANCEVDLRFTKWNYEMRKKLFKKKY